MQPSRFGVDLRPARQVVEAADAVPDAVARRAAADEQGADAEHRVFRGAGDDRLAAAVEDLHALALADGVVAEGRDAVGGQQHARALIGCVRLAVGAVAARQQHAGERPLARRQIQQCRDVMVRPALVDDLFDAVAGALDGADDLRIQRRLVGKAAEGRDELLAQHLLAFLHVVRRLQLGDGFAAGVELLLALGLEERGEHLARRHTVGIGLENGQVVGSAAGGGEGEHG